MRLAIVLAILLSTFFNESVAPFVTPLENQLLFTSNLRLVSSHLHLLPGQLGKHGVNGLQYQSYSSLRGGGFAQSLNASTSSSEYSDKAEKRKLSIALASCYFSVMGAKCALPTVLSLLKSPSIGLEFGGRFSPEYQLSRQVTVATLAVAVGKVVLGPVIDRLGGLASLKIALLSLSVLLATISGCHSFFVFGLCWVAVDFIFSACWAACINAIHQCFHESDWPIQIGNLAAAARAGNFLAFIGFASVLHIFEKRGVKQYWRPVFLVAAVAQAIPVVLITHVRKQTKLNTAKSTLETGSATAQPSFQSNLSVLQREAKTGSFWLHLVSRSALMIIASFLLFVPTLMTEIYGMSSSAGSQIGALYALGCFLSVTTLSKLYSKLRFRAKLSMITLLLGVGGTGSSIVQLGHALSWWTVAPWLSSLSMFAWGFSFAVPFYIPPSLYALSRGGKESSATIADVFDIGGFGLLAIFNGHVSGLASRSPKAWVPTFCITTTCTIISFAALSLALWLEEKEGK